MGYNRTHIQPWGLRKPFNFLRTLFSTPKCIPNAILRLEATVINIKTQAQTMIRISGFRIMFDLTSLMPLRLSRLNNLNPVLAPHPYSRTLQSLSLPRIFGQLTLEKPNQQQKREYEDIQKDITTAAECYCHMLRHTPSTAKYLHNLNCYGQAFSRASSDALPLILLGGRFHKLICREFAFVDRNSCSCPHMVPQDVL